MIPVKITMGNSNKKVVPYLKKVAVIKSVFFNISLLKTVELPNENAANMDNNAAFIVLESACKSGFDNPNVRK